MTITPQQAIDAASACDCLAHTIRRCQAEDDFHAIDWKTLIKTLLETLGPILLKLLLDWLTPVVPQQTK